MPTTSQEFGGGAGACRAPNLGSMDDTAPSGLASIGVGTHDRVKIDASRTDVTVVWEFLS